MDALLPLDLKAIQPAEIGRSDKMSWNLFRFMRAWRRKYDHTPLRVFHVPEEGNDAWNADATNLRGVTLGFRDDNWICGARLTCILHGEFQMWAYTPTHAKGAADITEAFCAAYLERGRCLFDPDHSMLLYDDDGRWTNHGADARTCNWCRHEQVRTVETVTTTRERWSSPSATAHAA